ncbi:MAG: CsgG/HfaB family protein [Myxococcota bacterium]
MSLSISLLALALAAAPARVAVLPFDNATTDAELEAVRGGLADLVASDLSAADSLVVVERARFADVAKELELQRTKYFDPKQTVRVGQALGATHLVLGTLVATAPKLKVSVRVVEVKGNRVVVNAAVTGTPADLFELEEQLVLQLARALEAKLADGTRSGHLSLAALGAYGQGLALADAGDLDAAKSKLAEAVRQSPDFELAKARYAEVLKRLREAQKRRGTLQDEGAKTLEAHLTAQLGKPPVERSLGARIGLANLALLELSRLLDAKRDEARWAAPEKRTDVERLEARFVMHAGALVAELRALKGQPVSPELSDEDRALSERLFGLDVSTWDFVTPASVASDVGNFLGSGWTPWRSDVPQFAVRPSAAQRSGDQLAAAMKWFDVAEQEVKLLPADERAAAALRAANERAELLLLLGRREEAVARWQGWLDAYPTAEDFPAITKKVEAAMLLDDDAERDEQRLRACDAGLLERAAVLATRTWRAKGRAGLEALGTALRACAKKDGRFERAAWSVPWAELRRVADCEAAEAWRAKAERAGVSLEACR